MSTPVQIPPSTTTSSVVSLHQLRTGMFWGIISLVWVFLLVLCSILPTRQRRRKKLFYCTSCIMYRWPPGREWQEHCTGWRRRQHWRLSEPSQYSHQLVSLYSNDCTCRYIPWIKPSFMCGACIVYGDDDGVFVIFPEPSLTPENLSTVLAIMEDRLWQGFGIYVNIPDSELSRIRSQCSSDRERKQAVIPYLISHHPCLSWTLIASALYRMGGGIAGDSSHRALDRLQQLFPTGTVYMYTAHSSLSATYRRISVKC